MNRAGNALPLVVVGAGGALAALVLRSRRADAAMREPLGALRAPDPTGLATVVPAAGAWVVPVPQLADRRPVISSGFGSPRKQPDGGTRPHLGADILFKRRSKADLAGIYPAGSPNGSLWHFMPDGVPALAASAGVVRFAEWTPQGFTVVIKHPNGWATYYTHMQSLAVARGDQVRAAQPIGLIGASPKDSARLRHLHWELWRGGLRSGAVDPAPYFAAWELVSMPSWAPPAGPVRNAGLAYRPVGSRGEPYPEWVRSLKGASGVYVIRQGGEVVYVGQSSAGKLYETLTRHLQGWRRHKGFWRGQYAEGHDPGLTYDRDRVEVAIRVTSPADALDEEARLIRRLRPRDNLVGQPDEAEVPF